MTPLPVSATKSVQAPPPFGVYEWCAIIGGLAYLLLPLGVVFPSVYELLAGLPRLDGARLAGFQSLMTLVAPIGFIYLFAAWNRYTSLIELTIVWRLLWVAPWIAINVVSGTLEPTGALVIGALDLGLPLVALAGDGRRRSLISRLVTHFSAEGGRSVTSRVLTWEARAGFLFCTALAVIAALSPRQAYVESFVVSVVALYYLLTGWVAKQAGAAPLLFSFALRVILIAALLLCAGYGFKGETLTALATFAVVGLFLGAYTAAWERQTRGTSAWSVSRWMTMVSLFMMGMSVLWAAAAPLFTGNAQKLAVNIHRQDLIIGGFVILVGVLLVEVRNRAPKNTIILSWLLPMSALWFTLETKLLANLGVGSPFHPSWVAKGLAPRYAQNVAVDLTFSVATILMTALSTNYAATILLMYMPRHGWRLLAWTGILVVGASAMWMIAASSGIPAPIDGLPAFATIPPVIPVDPVAAVAIHIRDLVLGIILIAGGIILDRVSADSQKAARWTCLGAWALFLIPKVYLHLKLGA